MKNNEVWIAEITDTDSEIWSTDIEGNTREEVIIDGMKMAKEDGLTTFRVGKKTPIGIPNLDIDSILEDVYNQIYDQVGEVAEGFLDNVSKEQEKELGDKLNKVFFNWIKKHKLEPNCYIIKDDEFIEVK